MTHCNLPYEFIGEELERGFLRMPNGERLTPEEALATEAGVRRAIFTFVLVVNQKLEVIGIQETNCPQQFFLPGDKIVLDTSGKNVRILHNGQALSLVQEFDLTLRSSGLSRLRIKTLNLNMGIMRPNGT